MTHTYVFRGVADNSECSHYVYPRHYYSKDASWAFFLPYLWRSPAALLHRIVWCTVVHSVCRPCCHRKSNNDVRRIEDDWQWTMLSLVLWAVLNLKRLLFSFILRVQLFPFIASPYSINSILNDEMNLWLLCVGEELVGYHLGRPGLHHHQDGA